MPISLTDNGTKIGLEIAKKKSESNFDIVVVGGGMAGATAALALANFPIKIALIESIDPTGCSSPSYDQRAVALSAASVEIYKSMGLWSQIEPLAAAIKSIHISDKGRFGFTRLNVDDHPLDALGQVIPLEQTGPILWQAIKSRANISLFCPMKIVNIDSRDQRIKNKTISIEIQRQKAFESKTSKQNKENINLKAKLLLAADGTFSNLAKLAHIKTTRTSYEQHAIIANITTEKPHNNRAFERFTKHGPLALLPLNQNRMSLVWCQSEQTVQDVMAFDDSQFLNALQQAFGYRLGCITKVGARVEYPLALHLPEKTFDERLLLVGNSAHTLHPIAGQGFNIGLRDIAALVDVIGKAIEKNQDFGGAKLLKAYQQQRQADWDQTISATDSLVRLFSNEFFPLTKLRGPALALVDKVPFLKKKIAEVAMGFSGESAGLTRGLVRKMSNNFEV